MGTFLETIECNEHLKSQEILICKIFQSSPKDVQETMKLKTLAEKIKLKLSESFAQARLSSFEARSRQKNQRKGKKNASIENFKNQKDSSDPKKSFSNRSN